MNSEEAPIMLFRELQLLSMKASVRDIVESRWAITDDVEGRISQLIVNLAVESESLEDFRKRVTSVGVDPWTDGVATIFSTISRLKGINYAFKSGPGYFQNRIRRFKSSIKRVLDYEQFRPGENITGISMDETIDFDYADDGDMQFGRSSTHHPRKHIVTDYDIFEAQQLRKTGVAEARQYFEQVGSDLFSPATGLSANTTEVVLADRGGAKFLNSSVDVSSLSRGSHTVRLVKNPEGSMQQAVVAQVALAQERREAKSILKELKGTGCDTLSVKKEELKSDDSSSDSSDNVSDEGRVSSMVRGGSKGWQKKLRRSAISFGPPTMDLLKQRESLPIFQLKQELLQAVACNDILILIGETGSGKTTQITQYLAEAGYCKSSMVGCTQPRRISATSVAKRVAEEFGCKLGQEVGYSIRFDDCSSERTLIKYMTDGMLLREALVDPTLSRYSVIVLDEAHERTVSTDVLFGLCKEALYHRRAGLSSDPSSLSPSSPLKLIVTSATLEAEKFSAYFDNANIFRISGRSFPVDVFYANEPTQDYVEAAITTVMHIHLTEQLSSDSGGDILVFLTGQDEIDMACEILHSRMKRLADLKPSPLIILPVYSALPSEMQTAIFEPAPAGCRKCVIATNIAEASITIDGIVYVVDSGFCKIKTYNPKSGMDSLIVTPISQASARQRAGRAGRNQPGKCYRLYTEQAFVEEMLPTAVPEIQRSNLCNVALVLKAMGIDDLLGFDFMDKPSVHVLVNALETLWLLGALDEEGKLTKLGRRMAEFPIAPEEAKMLLAAVDLGCADDIIVIASMLSVQSVFFRPRDRMNEADERKRRFMSADGDHCTLLQVFRQWEKQNFSSKWCFENYLIDRNLRKALEVRKQLKKILDKFNLPAESAGKDYARIRKAICAGYFHNACKRDTQQGGGGVYKIMRDEQQVVIHPSSVLHQKSPEYVIYHELVQTSKEYIRNLCTIEPHWLPELAPNLFARAEENRLSKAKQAEKIKPLYKKFEDESVWRLSKRYAR